jgi:hypothetical protein
MKCKFVRTRSVIYVQTTSTSMGKDFGVWDVTVFCYFWNEGIFFILKGQIGQMLKMR